MTDVVRYALDQLLAAGLQVDPAKFRISGRFERCDVDGFPKGKKNGWYIAKFWRPPNAETDVVIGAYGWWQGTEDNPHKFSLPGVSLDQGGRAALRAARKELQQAQVQDDAERAKEVAEKAAGIWAGLPLANGRGPYLERKGVSAFGLKAGRGGAVVMPLRNSAGMITQLQFISPDGSKRFLSGPGKKGSAHLIGDVADEKPLVFAEGYATGASIHQATSWPVVICVDAGNLAVVAAAWRSLYPAAIFVFAGDDDHEKLHPKTGEPENAGRKKATAAARRFGAKVVFPRFNDPAGRSDFNDLHAEQGLAAVREQMLAAYTPTTPAASAHGADRPAWERQLVFGDKGLKPMVHNLVLVLENHPDWNGVLALDQFAQRVVKRRAPPYGGQAGSLEDADEIEMAAWFGRPSTYGIDVPTGKAHEAAVAVAQRHAFHPVRDYLQGLEWDGEKRLESFFADHCDADQTEVTAAFAVNFFLAAVARVMRPGCKADLMLVLEGPQGIRKSTLPQVLVGPEWYVDLGASPTDKDFYILIQGKWLVEISEMAAFAKSETSHIKRAVTVAVDNFRPPYARHSAAFPRQCLFYGTANDGDWQRDATGARRFMPIWINTVDTEAIAEVRDQLWAEAYARFQAGEPWWNLPEGAREQQELRYLEDIWAEPVWKWLQGKRSADRYASGAPAPIKTTTASEILWRALEMDTKKQSRQDQMRIGQLMARLGWTRKQRRISGTQVWEYHRPASPTADDESEA